MAIGLTESSGLGTGLAQVVQPQSFDTLESGVSNYITLETEKKRKAEEEAKALAKKREEEGKKILSDSYNIQHGLYIGTLAKKANELVANTQEEANKLVKNGEYDKARALISNRTQELKIAKDAQDAMFSPVFKDISKFSNGKKSILDWEKSVESNPELSITEAAMSYSNYAADLKLKKDKLKLDTDAQAMFQGMIKNMENVDISEAKKMYPNQSDGQIRKKVKQDIAIGIANQYYLQEKENYDALGLSQDEAIQDILFKNGFTEDVNLNAPKSPTEAELKRQPKYLERFKINREGANINENKGVKANINVEEVAGSGIPWSSEGSDNEPISIAGVNLVPSTVFKKNGQYYVNGATVGITTSEGGGGTLGGMTTTMRQTETREYVDVKLNKESQDEIVAIYNERHRTSYKDIDDLVSGTSGQESDNKTPTKTISKAEFNAMTPIQRIKYTKEGGSVK